MSNKPHTDPKSQSPAEHPHTCNGKGVPVCCLSSLVRGYVDENRGDRDRISRNKAPMTGVGGLLRYFSPGLERISGKNLDGKIPLML